MAGSEVTQKLHEETWNAASNRCCQSVQALCGRPNIVFENRRCSWNRSWWRSDLKICLFSENFAIFISLHQRRNERSRGTISPAPNHYGGGAKSHSNVITNFFKTVGLHLLPKDLRFEHGGAKLVSFPRRHQSRYAPAHHDCLVKMTKCVCKNTCPSVANYLKKMQIVLLIIEVIWP